MALCEMCGKEAQLFLTIVEGGELKVCPSCAKFGKIKDNGYSGSGNQNSSSYYTNKEKIEISIVGNFSSLIHQEREKRKMTQEEFARFLNEKESIVSKWENGTLKPRNETAKHLENVLRLTLLVRGKEEEDNDQIKAKPSSEGFTLGDFIKVKKRG